MFQANSINKTKLGGGFNPSPNLLDSEAVALYNRVIADGGIIPAGLLGCSNYIKAAKRARGISTLAQGYLSLAHPQYTGIRLATGTGPTAGNRAARTVYNALGATGDFIQTTAANQPLALVHSGTNYAWFPGVNGNFFSTPDNANNKMVGNMYFEVKITPSVLNTIQTLVSKNYIFRFNNARLRIVTNSTYDSTVDVPFSAGNTFWVKVVKNGTTIQFFTKTNDNDNYTQLGANVTDSGGDLPTSTLPVSVGSGISGTTPFLGTIHYISYGFTDGTPTQIFNPANYNRATSQTSWTSTTGEVWTLNTPSTNNALKAAIVDTTMFMGNGTSYGMQAASLNMDQPAITSYTAFRKYVNTAGLQIINELGANIVASPGKALAINTNANQEDIWISANVGGYNSRFTSTNLGLKLATAVNNIANANESSPYLINNSSQSFVANDSIANNTANMNATGYNLLARNNAASLWANAFLVSDCVTIGEDNSTQRTSMYNFFKSYINGI